MDLVLKTQQGGLTGQVVVGGPAFVDELEIGIVSERVMIVLVLIAREDSKDLHSYHLKKGILKKVRTRGSFKT